MSSLLSIKRAIISVFDKTKLIDFANTLTQQKIKLLSTEGTAQILLNSGITACKISKYTKIPEIIDKRIKTLHHKIYSGILSRKGLDDAVLNKYNIQSIDMVIVNFYPFHTILKNNQNNLEKILEYIDIGGPTMVRAAAKNYKNTVVVTNYQDYDYIINELHKYNGSISLKTRFMLAVKAFKYITEYDSIISNYFNNQAKSCIQNQSQRISNINNTNMIYPNSFNLPDTIKCMNIKFIKKQNLRYGENPHQGAALYIKQDIQTKSGNIAHSQQLQGKPLSYNNIIDADTALECVKTFQRPTCVIVKHTTPCGVATSNTINIAYNQALEADPISAFGGIIAFNRPLNDESIALSIIQKKFVEVIIAPDIHQNCLNILSKKENIRILKSGQWNNSASTQNLNIDFKRISGGILIQNHDYYNIEDHLKKLKIVTHRHPTEQETEDLLFCWKIVKFVKSNAIVCGKNQQTTGIGTGQTNRVLAVKIATTTSKLQNNLKINGSVMASEAFFPFPDSIHIAAEAGISCIIQPGGSIQDSKIIETANHYNIAMIFTNIRHFRH